MYSLYFLDLSLSSSIPIKTLGGSSCFLVEWTVSVCEVVDVPPAGLDSSLRLIQPGISQCANLVG